VATIAFNRPHVLNAMTDAVMQGVLAALDQVEKDPAVRVLVLRGMGGRAFSVGSDIFEYADRPRQGLMYHAELCQAITRRLEDIPKPTIAAIAGHALGGGFEVALACDFRIVTADSQFGLPEIDLGVLAAAGTTGRLSQVVGTALAKEMLLLGRPIRAERALAIGLVTAVVPDAATLDMAVAELTAELMKKDPIALGATKRLLALVERLDRETVGCLELLTTSLCANEGQYVRIVGDRAAAMRDRRRVTRGRDTAGDRICD
jgi:enoyl-CoA hydratase